MYMLKRTALRPPKADLFVRSPLECWIFHLFYMFFCSARYYLLDIVNSQSNFEFTGSSFGTTATPATRKALKHRDRVNKFSRGECFNGGDSREAREQGSMLA